MVFESNRSKLLMQTYENLRNQFNITLLGKIERFLGCIIAKSPSGINIDQGTYVRYNLKSYGLEHANPTMIPLSSDDSILKSYQENE